MIKNPKKLFKIFFKLTLFIGVGVIIALVVLFKLGGQNDQLREGAEEFLSNISGGRAIIKELNYLGFYPNIKMDIDDTIFQERGDPTNIVMTLDALHFSMPFSHYVSSKKTVEAFSLTNFKGKAGFPFSQELIVHEAVLKTANDVAAGGVFEFNGSYGGQDFHGGMPVLSLPYKQDRILHKLDKAVPFEFITKGFSFFTTLVEGKKKTNLTDIRIVEGDKETITGGITLMNKDNVVAAGTLNVGSTVFEVEVEFKSAENEPASIDVKLSSADVSIEDVLKIRDSLKTLFEFFYVRTDDRYNIGQAIHLQTNFDLFRCNESVKPFKSTYVYTNEGGWSLTNDLTQIHPCMTYLSDYLDNDDTIEEGQN